MFRKLILVLVILGMGTNTACSLFAYDSGSVESPSQQTTITAPVATNEVVNENPVASGPIVLRVWIPPQFGLDANVEAAALFQNKVQTFHDTHPGIRVELRVKAVSGAGGLLDSLAATQAAVPDALPDLIALSRQDLEEAAIKGLVYPFPSLSPNQNDEDWYDFAQSLARMDDTIYGIPFAADVLTTIYRPSIITDTLPLTWSTALSATVPILFAAGSPEAVVPLAMYQSTGGALTDAEGRPTMDLDKLLPLFEFYNIGNGLGVFPSAVTRFSTEAEVYQAYVAGDVNVALTWMSYHLQNPGTDTAIIPIPTPEAEFALAGGWMWAMGNSNHEKQALAVELAHHLTESDYLGKWTRAVGYLPPRPSSLAAWPQTSESSQISRAVLNAVVPPAVDVTATLKPILHKATLDILLRAVTPLEAIESVRLRLGLP